MPSWRPALRILAVAIFITAIWFPAPNVALAGLFTKIFREAADGASGSGKLPGKLADLDVPHGVAVVLTELPEHAKKRSLISEATPEGHLRLTNLVGETVTASTADEVTSALKWLLPEASDLARRNVDFYFPPSALADGRTALNNLPRTARAHIAYKRKSYPVIGSPPFEAKALRVRLRSSIVVRATTSETLQEAIWQLDQPLAPSQIRVLTLDPTTSNRLQSAGGPDGNSRSTNVEAANPYDLATSMRPLKRQTVIVSGKIENEVLYFTPPSGKTQSVRLSDLKASAARDDVNLIVLNTDSARQPGVRNLLWQRARVDGLKDALKATTVGDFWSALASGRSPLQLSVSPSGKTSVSISAEPLSGLASKLPDNDDSLLSTTERILEDAVASVTGDIITTGIEATLRSKSRQQELDLRIIQNLPAMPQILYIIALVVGLAGLRTIRNWWKRVWPLRERASFASTLGWLGNRLLRFVPFVLVFMPLVAFVATPYQMIKGPIGLAWLILSAPFRWIAARSRAT